MRTSWIAGILAVTTITSIIYLFGILMLYSDGSVIHDLGNLLTLSRFWQVAAIPILIYLLITKSSPKFLVVPIVLIALFVWPFVESALGWSLDVSSRNLWYVALNSGLALYAAVLIPLREPGPGAPQPRRVI